MFCSSERFCEIASLFLPETRSARNETRNFLFTLRKYRLSPETQRWKKRSTRRLHSAYTMLAMRRYRDKVYIVDRYGRPDMTSWYGRIEREAGARARARAREMRSIVTSARLHATYVHCVSDWLFPTGKRPASGRLAAARSRALTSRKSCRIGFSVATFRIASTIHLTVIFII